MTIEYPKVIASSVIRSAIRGQSHGGLYVVDFNTETIEQVLDWNYPHIRWDSGGGDRGLRGVVFYDNYVFAAGATHLYVFNKNFELIDTYGHINFDGSHDLFLDNNILYVVSNQFDAILLFNVQSQQWLGGFQHMLDKTPQYFQNNEQMNHCDTMHIDAVSTTADGYIWYAGSKTKYMYGFNPQTQHLKTIQLYHNNTHNAQFWKDGIIYNRALESETCYQVNDKLIYTWPTPLLHVPSILGDYSRIGYTRGMAAYDKYIVIGTSPASVHLLSLENNQPLKSAWLSKDIRNSVCGVIDYPW